MGTSVHLIPEDFESSRNRLPRICVRMSMRILAVCIIIGIMIATFIIYGGLIHQETNQKRQIASLIAKHREHKDALLVSNEDYLSSIRVLPAEEQKEEIETSQSDHFSDHLNAPIYDLMPLNTLHQRIQFLRSHHHRRHPNQIQQRVRRHARDILSDDYLIDPLNMQFEPDFASLYAKVRNKRERIALNKLENEYTRCKLETARGNECMQAFAQMYRYMQDISEKMEKMKAIFKDTEDMQTHSGSLIFDSYESKEHSVKIDGKQQHTSSNVSFTMSVNVSSKEKLIDSSASASSSSFATTIKSTMVQPSVLSTLRAKRTTTTTKPRFQKVSPVKFSWIIDGHDENEKEYVEYPDVEMGNHTAGGKKIIVATTASTYQTGTGGNIEGPGVNGENNGTLADTITPTTVTNTTKLPLIEKTTVQNDNDEAPEYSGENFSWILDGRDSAKSHEDTVHQTDTVTQNVASISAVTSSDTTPNIFHHTTEGPSSYVLVQTQKKANIETDGEREADYTITEPSIIISTLQSVISTEKINPDINIYQSPQLPLTVNYNSKSLSEISTVKSMLTAATMAPVTIYNVEIPVSDVSIKSKSPSLHRDTTFSASSEAVITYGGACKTFVNSKERMAGKCSTLVKLDKKPKQDASQFLSSLPTATDPFDKPSSLENMLDSFEHNQNEKRIIPNIKMFKNKSYGTASTTIRAIQTSSRAPTSATISHNPYDRKQWEAILHPLDDPSSLENMLNSFEHNQNQKQIITDKISFKSKTNAPASATTSVTPTRTEASIATPISHTPYDRMQWQAMFQEAAQMKNSSTDNNANHSDDQLIDLFSAKNARNFSNSAPALNRTSKSKLGPMDAQFLTLCERIALRNKAMMDPKGPKQPTADFTPSPVGMQFTSRAPGIGFPVTGETMKASAQFMFNPQFMMPSIPICFYVTPSSFRIMNQMPMWTPSFYGGGGASGGFGGGTAAMLAGGGGGGAIMGGGGPGGIFFVPQNAGVGPMTNFFVPQSSGTAGGTPGNMANIFSKNASPQKKQPQQFYCTYMQNPNTDATNQGGAAAAVGGGASHGAGMMGFSNANFKMRKAHTNAPLSDIIYASFANLTQEELSIPLSGYRGGNFECSLPGQRACFGGNECVNIDSWCDGLVDCSDGSDETTCTCRRRLPESRHCDGYADCPLGEDEIGCFGCDEFMYSCYSDPAEYEKHNRSSISMCYSVIERCDGFQNCLNGRDETECSIIVANVAHHMSHSVSSAEGFLYRNHRGEWYPVCNNAEHWARDACNVEDEYNDGSKPNVSFRNATLSGPFIEPSLVGSAHFPQSCQQRDGNDVLIDQAAYVKCPPAKCGLVKQLSSNKLEKISKRMAYKIQNKQQNNNNTADKQVSAPRIVGGDMSQPLQWPFVVALYRNGVFHCGATIYSATWLISAAHCVINYHKYYYEVRAGLLRRSSYAASSQIQPVAHIIVHQAYERKSMRNDLSLLRLAEPLQFNRWVKPICLPNIGRTTAGDDWIWGPEKDTICTVVGWGAVREKGPGSDQLREVSVPIRKRCTEKVDQEAEAICAGDVTGGRDACQGDSGGPLFCRSVTKPSEWYLAGVVSHGNGCAQVGQFGVYTRVALYLDWIEMAMRSEFIPVIQPLKLCPGYVCVWGGQRCMPQRKRCNRIVDCLGGEDEVGCIYNFAPDVSSVGVNNMSSTTESDYHPENAIHAKNRMVSTTVNSITTTNFRMETTPSIMKKNQQMFTIRPTESPPDVTSFSLVETPTTSTIEPAEILTTSTTVLPTKPEKRPKKTTSPTTNAKFSIKLTSTLPTTPLITRLTTPLPIHQITPHVEPTIGTERIITTTSPTKIILTTDHTIESDHTTLIDAVADESMEVNVFTLQPSSASPIATDSVHESSELDVKVVETQPKTTTISPVHSKIDSKTANVKIQLPDKFICRKIPQIIDAKHHCDRSMDCDDGTDEEDCTCRDYLKGPLSILVCDGKTDCEDLSDEADCGRCAGNEFLCPLSKMCISLDKRCDSSIDCKFNEDEQDCFALTNGMEIEMDVNRQPKLSHVGVFSRNTHGVWRIVCTHETSFHQHSAKTAGDVCALLGFRGYRFYNTTKEFAYHRSTHHSKSGGIPIDPELVERHPLSSHLSAVLSDNMQLGRAGAEQKFITFGREKGMGPGDKVLIQGSLPVDMVSATQCIGLYLECNPRLNRTKPLRALSAGVAVKSKQIDLQKMEPTLQKHGKPNVFVGPASAGLVEQKKKEEILDKLSKIIDGKVQQDAAVLVHDQLHEAVEELHWPWLVDIYVNGRLWCLGVLLDRQWVLVHESCLFAVRFNTDYVVALLGGGKTKTTAHSSPNEQVRRVDCYEAVPSTNVLLYHLKEPVHYTHHVLPTFLPDSNNGGVHECIAVLHDNRYGRVKTVSIKQQKHDPLCTTAGLPCYRLHERRPPFELLRTTASLSTEDLVNLSTELAWRIDNHKSSELDLESSLSRFTSCTQFGMAPHPSHRSHSRHHYSYTHDAIDQGLMVCREHNSGWYPAALFDYNNTNCNSFREPFFIRTLERAYGNIVNLLDRGTCGITHSEPNCTTHRCPLGACLTHEQMCDGYVDCHDGSDENSTLCLHMRSACSPSELTCQSSRKCVPKIKFCDHNVDCEDLTDEPTVCSCFTYLQATEPSKICDGVRNCWDKSDESPALCNCTAELFPCGLNHLTAKECIPRDFVCDHEVDCPNGEDERYCYGIEEPVAADQDPALAAHPSLKHHDVARPPIYGQLIEQSFGVWHTKCFPRQTPPDLAMVRTICKQLGYDHYREPSYRLIDDLSQTVVAVSELVDMRGRSFSTEPLAGRYRDSTKVVIANKFSSLHLNDQLTLFLKSSRPIAELVRWNTSDSRRCLRLELRCL